MHAVELALRAAGAGQRSALALELAHRRQPVRARARPPRSRRRRRNRARRRGRSRRSGSARPRRSRRRTRPRRLPPRPSAAVAAQACRSAARRRRARTARGGSSRGARARRARVPSACAGAPRRAGGSRACSCRRRTCPTSACLRRGARRARSALTPQPSLAESTIVSAAGRGGDVRRLGDRVAGEVALRAHDQDLDAAAARERHEALEPAEVEVHVERGGHEAQVDVRGQRLLARAVVGAREEGAPREDVADRLASAQRDPVAGRRQFRRPREAASSAPAAGTSASIVSPRTA